MLILFVSDAPRDRWRRWFVWLDSHHPWSSWPGDLFALKRFARGALAEIGCSKFEINAILSVAERHPVRMSELPELIEEMICP